MYSEDNHPDSAQTKPKTQNIFTSPKPLEDSHLGQWNLRKGAAVLGEKKKKKKW
jgi:hypothetical protein